MGRSKVWCFLLVLLFLPFINAIICNPSLPQGCPEEPSQQSVISYVNYSTIDVNNSQFLQGYTPTTLATNFLNTYFYPLNSNPAGYFNVTTLPLTNLSAYWLNNGSSKATGNWNIGTNSFQSVNVQADTTRVFVGTKSTAGSLTSTDSVYIGEAILGGLNRAISGIRNVGIGYSGLSRLSSGGYNTATGTEAGGVTTGSYNVFYGYRAGLYTLGTAAFSAPSNGVYIGASTESAAAGQTNEIVIGYGADGKGSNTAVLGNDDITATYLKGDVYMQSDNDDLFFGTGNDFSVGYDGTNAIFNTSVVGSGLAYFSNNISATGYITRTSTYDKSKGNALDLIKDSSELKDSKGEINHSKFYGYVQYDVTDYSKPVNEEICGIIEGKTQCETKTTYPYKKKEEGVNIVDEIELLRQSIYELKEQNKLLTARINKIEKETCEIKLFSWCIK